MQNPEGSEIQRKPSEDAYDQSLLSAWINTKMERDKSLLALSTAGIGLLVTVLAAVGPMSRWQIALYACAFGFFIIITISCLLIFERNAEYISSLHEKKKKKSKRIKRSLTILDKICFWAFLAAVLFSISIGITSGLMHLTIQGG